MGDQPGLVTDPFSSEPNRRQPATIIARTMTSAFVGLLNRDLRVLRRSLGDLVGQVVLQPLLLVFTFTYVLPHIGLGFTAGSTSYATLLVPGLLAATALTTAISTVTTPLTCVGCWMSRALMVVGLLRWVRVVRGRVEG